MIGSVAKVILLLDVDETLCVAESSLCPYRFHHDLISVIHCLCDVLKSAGAVVETLLFSAQCLHSPAFVFVPEDEPLLQPSRLKLLRHLAAQQIDVKGVVTTPESAYNASRDKPLGCYYSEAIFPFDAVIESGHNVDYEDAELRHLKSCEDKLLRQYGSIIDKGVMFHYVMDMLKSNHACTINPAALPADTTKQTSLDWAQDNDECWVILVDDSERAHADVAKVAASAYPDVSLCSILVSRGGQDFVRMLYAGLEPLLQRLELGESFVHRMDQVLSPKEEAQANIIPYSPDDNDNTCTMGCVLS